MNSEDIEKLLEPVDEKIVNKPRDPVLTEIPKSPDEVINEFPVDDPGGANIIISHTPAISEKTAQGQVAKKLAEMLYSGVSKESAMKALGIEPHEVNIRELMIETNSFLLQTYSFPDEARRLMVKASLNKVLSEAIQSNDSELILKAAKQIASDPDVGLTAAPQQVINISLEKAQDALNKAAERPEFDFES